MIIVYSDITCFLIHKFDGLFHRLILKFLLDLMLMKNQVVELAINFGDFCFTTLSIYVAFMIEGTHVTC